MINAAYKPFSALLDACNAQLKSRLKIWDDAERTRREAVAAEAQRALEDAQQAMLAAAAQRDEAIDDAQNGAEADLAGAIVEAQTAEKFAARAGRAAAVALRDVSVRIPTGMGRALSSRRTPVYTITDPIAAVAALGLTEKIEDAIRQCAIAYKDETGVLPPGVTLTYDRRM
jgi:hypothetical protein